MPRGLRANIHDRQSIEQIYPRNVFNGDAANNADGKATTLKGVLIESAPDARGEFTLIPASRSVAECAADEASTVFLCPHAVADFGALVDTGIYSAPEEKSDPAADRAHEYDAFIDRILTTVKAVKFQLAIGIDEERLKGFHGG